MQRSLTADSGTAPLPPAPVRQHYLLREDEGYFITGRTADGRQVLLRDLFRVFFDEDGVLLGSETETVPVEPDYHPVTGRALSAPEYAAAVDEALENWANEVDFELCPIRVRKFSLPDEGVGIEDRTGFFDRFLAAPELVERDADERATLFQAIQEWDERGCFVLYWGNELEIDGEGRVIGS